MRLSSLSLSLSLLSSDPVKISYAVRAVVWQMGAYNWVAQIAADSDLDCPRFDG